jgi:hypothetical protein
MVFSDWGDVLSSCSQIPHEMEMTLALSCDTAAFQSSIHEVSVLGAWYTKMSVAGASPTMFSMSPSASPTPEPLVGPPSVSMAVMEVSVP